MKSQHKYITMETPPQIGQNDLFNAYSLLNNSDVSNLVEKINCKYEYWSDVKYKKLPRQVKTAKDLWCCVKLSRFLQKRIVWKEYGINMSITNEMQRLCHEFDMHFGGSWGNDSVISGGNREQYLIGSLMEEAISSSQMEGAATTRKVAKEMLRKELTPNSRSEQMIYNNYKTIRFIVDHKKDKITPELILHIHELMTTKTLDHESDAGSFRMTNDVVVENATTHEVVHTPPNNKEIPPFIEDLCLFFNEIGNSKQFIHPIVKGIIVHFMIAYVHPFVDGNGRTARALFYWYMLKRGYWLTEYMSISRIIYKSKVKYENAYLYTEIDGNDLGYFISYNLRVLNMAFEELKKYIERKQSQRYKINDFLRIGNINERQASIIQIIFDNPKTILTIKELGNRFAISHTTAKADVNGLLEREILEEIAINKVKKNYMKGSKFDELVKSISRIE